MGRTVTYRSVKGLNRALRALPKALQAEVRDASAEIAADVAARAAARASSTPGVARHVAPTLKARRDGVPKVVMGGTTSLPARNGRSRGGPRQTVGDVMWGAEFGSGKHDQFSPWRGSADGAGYFLFPTVDAMADEIEDRYGDAILDAIDRAAR